MDVEHRAAGLALVALLLLGCSPDAEPSRPRLEVGMDEAREEFGTVLLTGVDPASRPSPAAWGPDFAVFTAAAAASPEPLAVLGSYAREAGGVRFRPRFPFVPGQQYVARFAPADLELIFSPALPPSSEAACVSAIYPSADVVPANLLRLYVHFSRSMSRGFAAQYLRLFNEDGSEVSGAFAPGDAELWDAATTRLTVLLDPGRIKRDVGPHDAVGPPLREGASYRLVVEAGWPDGAGTPIARGFEKRFRTGPPDRVQPTPATWQLAVPARPDAALRVSFPEPLDHGLLGSCLSVVGPDGQLVAGTAEVENGERSWLLTPDEPWRRGHYSLLVAPTLEDPAGNSVARAFETALDATSRPLAPLSLAFEIQ